jgi:sulfotransferase family protein
MPDDHQPFRQAGAASTAGPILLGGDHRSGTTLVSVVLDAHPDVVFGPELDFRLPADLGAEVLACCDLELAGDPAVAGAGVSTADGRWRTGIQFVRQCHRFGVPPTELRDLVRAHLAGGAALVEFAERAALIEDLGASRRRSAGVERWGFKIQRDIVDAASFQAVWPDARFVHVVRDGRDVVASHLRSGYEWAYRTAAEAATGWTRIVSTVPRRELNNRLFELRYEDLVADPEPVLRQLLAFLELRWHEAVLRHDRTHHALATHPYDHPSADAATRPIGVDAAGRFRRDLTTRQLAEVEAIAGSVLRAWGYEP